MSEKIKLTLYALAVLAAYAITGYVDSPEDQEGYRNTAIVMQQEHILSTYNNKDVKYVYTLNR